MPEEPQLDFHGSNTLQNTHGLHPFAAKFPPQLAAWAIETFSHAGETVCDPMCGSGTVLVEACRLRRIGIGGDIDPLACLLTRAKSTPLEEAVLDEASERLLSRLNALAVHHAQAHGLHCVPEEWGKNGILPLLPNLNYWFLPSVQVGLVLIRRAIAETEAPSDVTRFWHVIFSSLISAKSSVANARDLVHSRHHHCLHPEPPDPLARFARNLKRGQNQMRRFVAETCAAPAGAVPVPPLIDCFDCRRLPIANSSIDLIVTSPPYANALDYTRAHKFSVAWLADALQTPLDAYVQRGRDYIGSERGHGSLISPATGIKAVDSITTQVEAVDAARGKLVGRYLADMRQALQQMERVLTPGGHAVLVVCPSSIRKITIPWHEAFAAMGANLPSPFRLRQTALIVRALDDRKRILPYMNAGAQLSQRMREEYVLVLRKEAA